jgi:hypothetical protein
MQQVNLDEITDIKELKVMKADQYDALEAGQRQVQASQQNIQVLNARITQLQQAAPELKADDRAKMVQDAGSDQE